MIDWQKHYREVYATEINRIKMKDVVGFAFDGPAYIPGQQGFIVGWHMMLTLKHNRLIGQPDIGVHIPVMGMTPTDDIIRQGAKFLLENAREERHKMESPVETQTTQVDPNVPRQGDGSPLPPGLLPQGVAGSATTRRVQESPAGFKATAVGHKEELPELDHGKDKPKKKKVAKKEESEPIITDSESGAFKIVDRRRRAGK